ncbi:MAG: hypothetical protein NC124_13905 [Clostridium sp.]|nr:hypothetical protein [Clostridium sp.]
MESRKKKIVLNYILAVCLISVCIPLDSIDVFVAGLKNPESMVDAQYFWLNSITYAGIYGGYFISVLAALPFTDCFCQEYQQGILRYVVARMGNFRYVIRNFEKAFLYGAAASCGGGFLFLLGSSGVCDLFDEKRFVEITFLPFSGLLSESPVLYFAVMLYLLFLAGGLWSCVGYCFSVYVPVRHLVYLFPFVASFVLTRVNTILQLPEQWRIDFMLCGRSGPNDALVYLIVLSVIVLLMICFCVCLFYKKLKWRMENE